MPPHLVKYAEKYEPVEVGCSLWDNCFTCPLDVKFCGNGERVDMGKEKNKTAVILLYNEGYDVKEIAEKLGKSVRTIDRYLEEITKSAMALKP